VADSWFNKTAASLARNPLGIIALFIVLVYGFASMVTTAGSSLTLAERLPLVYFLVFFPVIVLIVFAWLVSCHHHKLFSPSDYKNEDNFVKMQITATASLAAAFNKTSDNSNVEVSDIASAVREIGERWDVPTGNDWRSHILWVDDRPANNIFERRAFEAFGVRFTLALSTEEAFQKISSNKFSVIISDMERKEGPREGYVLLDRLRELGNKTPLFFYASSNSPEHKRQTLEHGGQGCTNDPNELFDMVMKSVIQR
jgi:CheY-like chemotaxis protein